MKDEPKALRIPIMMSASEVQAIDDWMFENRKRSRAEAIRNLVQDGMLYMPTRKALQASRSLLSKIISGENADNEFRQFVEALDRYSEATEKHTAFLREQFDEIKLYASEMQSLAEKHDAKQPEPEPPQPDPQPPQPRRRDLDL